MEKLFVVVASEHKFEDKKPVSVLGIYTHKEYAVKRLKDKVDEICDNKLLTKKDFQIVCDREDFFYAEKFDEQGFETGDYVIYSIEESELNS